MTARPWMPLYVADFCADTAHLDAAQSGAYLMLIMHYWQTGGLPDNDAALMRIARMTPAQWKRERPTLQAFFHDGWRHNRIDSELAHAEDVSSKRRASANQKHSNRSANAHANAEQLDTHARGLPQSHPQSQTESTPPPSEARPSAPDDAAIAFADYNATAEAVGWPVAQTLTETRRRKLKQRLAECGGTDGWRAAMERAGRSAFLTGANDSGWKADLDFFLQSKSFTKLMEGSYDDRDRTANGRSPHDAILRAVAERFAPGDGMGERPAVPPDGVHDQRRSGARDREPSLDLGPGDYRSTV